MASNGGSVPYSALAAMYQRLVEVDGYKWQNNFEVVRASLSDLETIRSTHLHRWIEKTQVAREALAEIRDLDPSLTPDGFDRDELSSYSVEVGELAELALRDTE